ncbi:hypothetical protein [Streptomyces sp. NPDC050738]|uniref:SCO3933 family regulatory protein n=1 Tax=Streptomyces sp. NPDC050738 TaxID=3154744 RepID=UPI00341888C7
MRQIPVDTSAAMVMVAQPPAPKVKDRRTGELAMDMETGAQLMTIDVLFVLDGSSEVLTITAPQPAFNGEMAIGTMVGLTGLVARPWENEFNGQKRHGISFRAVAVTSLASDTSKVKAA